MPEYKPVTFYYHASMLPYFNAGRDHFCKQTMLTLEGIEWAVQGEKLVVTVTVEQEERWLFYLGFCIGTAYGATETLKKKE